MSYIVKNWVDFVRKHKCQFAIVMVSQIGCMICLLLVYGVFQNQVYVMGDDEADNKSISASFEDTKIYSGDMDIKKLLAEILEESNMETEMIYIEAMSSDQENMYMDYVDYQEGIYSFCQSQKEHMQNQIRGKFPEKQAYLDNQKSVIVTEPDWRKMPEPGSVTTIDNEKYNIIGINMMGDCFEYYMPFSDFPRTSILQRISIKTLSYATRNQYQIWKEKMERAGAKVSDYFIADEQALKREYSILAISILLAALATGNNAIVYYYIYRKRKTQLQVFRICGCSRGQARRMYLVEILWNTILSLGIGIFLFSKLVYPIAGKTFIYLNLVYGWLE